MNTIFDDFDSYSSSERLGDQELWTSFRLGSWGIYLDAAGQHGIGPGNAITIGIDIRSSGCVHDTVLDVDHYLAFWFWEGEHGSGSGATVEAWLVARFEDADNFYMAGWYSSAAFQGWRIGKRVDGTETVLASSEAEEYEGGWQHVLFQTKGNTLSLKVKDVEILSVEDADLQVGEQVGVLFTNTVSMPNHVAYFDDLDGSVYAPELRIRIAGTTYSASADGSGAHTPGVPALHVPVDGTVWYWLLSETPVTPCLAVQVDEVTYYRALDGP